MVIENVAQTRRLAETALHDDRPTNTGSGSNEDDHEDRYGIPRIPLQMYQFLKNEDLTFVYVSLILFMVIDSTIPLHLYFLCKKLQKCFNLNNVVMSLKL